MNILTNDQREKLDRAQKMGNICFLKMDNEHEQGLDSIILTGNFQNDIICKRHPEGIYVNIPQVIVRHSPTGFEWGYGGSGPADFALNILAQYIGNERANTLYQRFKWEFIATLPDEGGVIRRADVLAWVAQFEGENHEY